MMIAWLRSSLRRRLIALVTLGAILPMAIVGWWLTQAAVRSAKDRLHTELDSSLAVIAGGIEKQWETRRGDVLLVAENEVVARTTAAPSSTTAGDSAYMRLLFESVHVGIPSFRVQAADSSTVWTFAETASNPHPDSINQRARSPLPEGAFVVHVPVKATDAGVAKGVVEAFVRLSSVVPAENTSHIVGGAVFDAVDRATGRGLVPTDGSSRTGLISARRRLVSPALDLTLAAPATPFIGPFQDAARFGLLALSVVAAIVLAMSVYLTTRLTASLTQLQDAATAVSHGDLERRIPGHGEDEIGRLAEAFNAMTDNLRRTLRDLSHQQALAAVGEYAAALSHEVRNALSSVRVDLQRAEERADDPAKTRALLSRALQNVQHLDVIVSGSLTVARQGRTPLERIDLRDVIDASVAAAEPTFARNGGIVMWNRGSDELLVDGDLGALKQVFTNVLINAGQSLRVGGETVVESTVVNGACRVTTRDTGVGIATDRVARIGEPFYSSKTDGTGIGLAIARRILRAHAGQLTIESELGVGTTVHIDIPRSLPLPEQR